jgi:hypothetical protein
MSLTKVTCIVLSAGLYLFVLVSSPELDEPPSSTGVGYGATGAVAYVT